MNYKQDGNNAWQISDNRPGWRWRVIPYYHQCIQVQEAHYVNLCQVNLVSAHSDNESHERVQTCTFCLKFESTTGVVSVRYDFQKVSFGFIFKKCVFTEFGKSHFFCVQLFQFEAFTKTFVCTQMVNSRCMILTQMDFQFYEVFIKLWCVLFERQNLTFVHNYTCILISDKMLIIANCKWLYIGITSFCIEIFNF